MLSNYCALVRAVALVLLSLCLVACSSGKIVKTWEGDEKPANELALLTAPEHITLLAVDGKAMPDYLLQGLTTTYSLLPGEHILEFKFETLWAVARKAENSSPSRVVSSEPQQVRVRVEPGQQLTFRYPTPGNLRDAEAIAATFSAELVDAQGRVVAKSVPAGTYTLPDTEPLKQAQAIAGVSESDVSRLDALKVLWSRLSAEEKKAFLSWAFE